MRSCRVRAAVSFLRKGTARSRFCRPTGVRQSGSRALALTTLPGEHADYGTLLWSSTQQSCTGTRCHLCRAAGRLLGQSAWPRSILRNELDDSGHRGSSVGSQGRVLSSETRVSSVRRALFGTLLVTVAIRGKSMDTEHGWWRSRCRTGVESRILPATSWRERGLPNIA